ncbi:hypothetical protein ACT7CX_00375 [Bacillus cereus]
MRKRKQAEKKLEYQTAKIKGTSVNRQFDNAWRNRLDEDEPDYDQDAAKNWFKEVPEST